MRWQNLDARPSFHSKVIYWLQRSDCNQLPSGLGVVIIYHWRKCNCNQYHFGIYNCNLFQCCYVNVSVSLGHIVMVTQLSPGIH
jgi:hypothetical protein